MSARSSRWARGSAFRDPQMRISDADRADVADRLSKHYSDGRLDQAEFDERIDRAMRAKTQGDLTGLFADLPPLDEPEQPGKPGNAVRRPDEPAARRRPVRRTLGLILIVLVAIIVGRALTVPFFPFAGHALALPFVLGGGLFWSPVVWLVIAVLVFLWWRATHRHRP
jgi:Domain of unknown function (DUF1707)